MLRNQESAFIQNLVALEPMQLVAIAILLILIAVMVHAVFTSIRDYWKVPVQKTVGIIQEKVFFSPCFSNEMSISGKGIDRVYHKAEYRIKVRLFLDGEPSLAIMTEQKVYEAANEGSRVSVSYKKGRNTGELRILEVSLA